MLRLDKHVSPVGVLVFGWCLSSFVESWCQADELELAMNLGVGHGPALCANQRLEHPDLSIEPRPFVFESRSGLRQVERETCHDKQRNDRGREPRLVLLSLASTLAISPSGNSPPRRRQT